MGWLYAVHRTLYTVLMAHPSDDIVSAMHSLSSEDRDVIRRAYDFAEKAHGAELRKSGEPYIVHPHAIALYLADIGMDRDTVVAGILHDTTEDTDTPIEAIEEHFGKTVRFLVESVTKLSKLKYRGLERHVESLRQLLVATASDIRVIIIKMADRIHNMRTIQFIEPAEKRERIARETMEVYVPIAERLGMGNVKAELEDLAFAVLEPKRYEELTRLIEERKKELSNRIDEDIKDLKKALAENGIRTFRTEYRVKGVHSFARKALKKYDNDITNVFDLFALRVILKTSEDCYRALGIIHGLWRPIPGKVKDYIAFAKPNGYRSIHTTTISRRGVTIELQIRTGAMHLDAQYGVASHYNYKERKKEYGESTIEWIQNLLPSLKKTTNQVGITPPQWLKDLTRAEQEHPEYEVFEDILKKDFFAERIFVFTPHGDVIDLPFEATPVDFAYCIHSDLGDTMVGAKINGKLAAFETKLKNGDIVEIITKEGARPNKKWLEFVKTAGAKNNIRNTLKKLNESN